MNTVALKTTPPDVTSTDASNEDDNNHDGNFRSKSQSESQEEIARRQRRAQRVAHFRRHFSVWDLLDPQKPWVLVEKGSFLGFFNYVPEHLRVGSWSAAAISYLVVLYYMTALVTAYYISSVSVSDAEEEPIEVRSRLAAWTAPWYYHILGFGWMNYINYLVLTGPLGYAAWTTYTIQSWTLLTVRHLLCIAAPFWSWARWAADWMRFPVACSGTVTFTVWNAVLFPVIYWFLLRSDLERHNFYKFATSFRLMNIHVLNIVLVILNCGPWGDPPARRLSYFPDLYLAAVSAMAYLAWYFWVCDRLGIHLYPVFSPRTVWVVASWTVVSLAYLVTFWVWQYALVPESERYSACDESTEEYS